MKRPSLDLAFPALLVVVTVATYGVLLARLGFYRDDWYLLATAQSEGTAGIIALFQIDRPLVGYFYAAAYRLLGVAPLAWHAAALALRLLGNLIFWQLLRVVWPTRHAETLVIALLFSVYPGYSVQPNAAVYITDLGAHAAALLSFLLMLGAMNTRQPAGRFGLSAIAGALQLLYLGIFESAIGMEIARFAIAWHVISKRDRAGPAPTTWRALKSALPYILLAGCFLVWRLFIFQSSRRATNLDVLVGRYGMLPLRSVFSVAIETLKDMVESTFLAWTVPFYQFSARSTYRDFAIAMAVAAVVIGLVLLFARRALASQPPPDGPSRTDTYSHMMGLGALIVFFALLPIDLAGRNVLFADQWDRYTLYASSGVALVIGGAAFRFLNGSSRRGLLVALIGMSVSVHYFSAAWYRDFWDWQRDLWQQMVWRAPGLKPGTMLFVEIPVGGYQEGYEIYGPANVIYFPGERLQIGGDVINSATVARLQLGKNREHFDRSVLVADNYRNALVALYPTLNSCLHVLDGNKVEIPGLVDDSLAAEAALYSRIEMIESSGLPAILPSFLEGHSPRPWCQYYQRMALARQEGSWQEVARLADEALSLDLAPDDVSEIMPALEAYATLGRTQEMRRAAAIVRSDDGARAFLCLQLQRGTAYPPPYDYNAVNEAVCQAK